MNRSQQRAALLLGLLMITAVMLGCASNSERDAAALEISACLAMCSISSLLFTSRSPLQMVRITDCPAVGARPLENSFNPRASAVSSAAVILGTHSPHPRGDGTRAWAEFHA